MIRVDPEFQFLITPLTDTEFKQLEENILKDGCRDPLIIWKGQGLLIDGHNRYKICQKHNLPFRTFEREFNTREDAVNWIIDNQLGRRNLTDSQIAYLRGKRYESEKKQGVRSDIVSPQNGDKLKTSERLAEEFKVSKNTIERDAKFAKAIDTIKRDVGSGFSQKILSEEVKLPKSDVVKLAEKPIEERKKIMEELKTNEAKRLSDIETKISIQNSNRPVPTFNKTNDNIEWARWTWNPVTGCLHNCPYCYARDISNRFFPEKEFKPEFHADRLNAPKATVLPLDAAVDIGLKTVFVCSMADLFGHWVPQEWIDAVLKSVRDSPKWNFLFLTKNPKRLIDIDWPPNAWVGTTVDVQARVKPAEDAFRQINASVRFVSCEPLQENVIFNSMEMFDWIIIGGRSRSSNLPEFQPEWSWVESLLLQARKHSLKVYFKPNLTSRPREYPKER